MGFEHFLMIFAAGDDADTVSLVDGSPMDDVDTQSTEEAQAEGSSEGSDGAVPSSLAKAERAKQEREETGSDKLTTAAGKEIKMSSQKDITVADDFETTVRFRYHGIVNFQIWPRGLAVVLLPYLYGCCTVLLLSVPPIQLLSSLCSQHRNGVQERVDIYKTYLMFCMTGDVVQLPMGGTITVERDEQEFARLSQLGDLLGLGPMDVYKVRSV